MTKDAKRIFKNGSASSRSLAAPRMDSLHAHNWMKPLQKNEMMKSTGMCVYRGRPARALLGNLPRGQSPANGLRHYYYWPADPPRPECGSKSPKAQGCAC